MKVDRQIKAENRRFRLLALLSALILIIFLMTVSPLVAADYLLSGESSTIMRMRSSTDNRDLYPVYEYLRLTTSSRLDDGSTISFQLGAWGRLDLADKSTDKYSDNDLQYGFLSYRDIKSNFMVNLGRQFVSEGVAAEKIDGLYVRGDLAKGFSAAAFLGEPVLTESTFNGAHLVYGARVSHKMQKYYDIGFSALKNEASGSSRYREEQGVDIWLRPTQQLDLVSRSSYNSLTKGWMEHASILTYSPLDKLKASANINVINYRDYFHNVTTRSLSLTNGIINPDETLLSTGFALSYTILKDTNVTTDYKNYRYDIAGNADYLGFRIEASLPGKIPAGLAFHRMEGSSDRLRYNEYRLYVMKKIDKVNVAADLFNISYDKSINGVSNSFSLTGSAGYELSEKLKLGANLEYSRTPDFDRELRGFVKVIYAFDAKHSEGRSKNEK